MSRPSDSEIITALRQTVSDPPHAPARLEQVHRRARHRRRLQLSAGSLATVAVVALAATVVDNGWLGSGSSGDQVAGVAPAQNLAQLHQRPMHLPAVSAGARCPISASHTYPAGAGFNSSYTAVGDGPFTMTGDGVVPVNFTPSADEQYSGTGSPGTKVIWRVGQDYQGPVLLRGAKIDGNGSLRFDHYIGAVGGNTGRTSNPYPDVAYDTSGDAHVVNTYPGAIRVFSAGCYAIQVDGTSFSDVIVFAVTSTG